MTKIYLDNDVIINYSFQDKNPRHWRAANGIISRFKAGKDTGIITNLTLVELAGTCQRFAFDEFTDMVGDGERLNYARNEGSGTYMYVVRALLKMSNIRLENVTNLEVQTITQDALTVVNETTGRVALHSGSPKFKRAGATDIMHVLLARHVKCDEFHTFDRAIKMLEDHPKICPLRIILHTT